MELVTIVFTDGACSGNPGPGGYGAIVARADGIAEEFGGSEAHTTNNRMELFAALVSLRALTNADGPVQLYTDSQYLIQGVTAWIFGWIRNGWKTSQGADVSNRDLWEELHQLNSARKGSAKIAWNHVPGHSNVAANERCDAIATSFAQGN